MSKSLAVSRRCNCPLASYSYLTSQRQVVEGAGQFAGWVIFVGAVDRFLGVYDQQTVVDAVEDLRKLFQHKLTSGSHSDRIAEQAASDFGSHRRNCETHDGVTNHDGRAENGDLQTYNANLLDAYQTLGAIGRHQNVDVVAQSILYRIVDQRLVGVVPIKLLALIFTIHKYYQLLYS